MTSPTSCRPRGLRWSGGWTGGLLLLGVLVACSPAARERDAGPETPPDASVDAGPEDAGPEDLGLGPDGCRPVAERCNGLDDDCDGYTDEDFLLARDPQHCGACDHRCQYGNGAGGCRDSLCYLARCTPGYANLDGREDNGCESRCTLSNGGIEICDGQDNDCNGLVDDGYDLVGDPANCGECGHRCSLRHAEAVCRGGECRIGRCDPSWYDEDDDPLTGCEATCAQSNGGVEGCDGEDNDCDGRTDEDFDLRDDPEHCGRCGRVCSFPNAVPRCLEGECVIDRCLEGWSDDGVPEDGCETPCVLSNGGVEICDDRDNDCDGTTDDGFDLATNVDHCGQCGRECRIPNGVAVCVDSECLVGTCEAGYIDGDGRYDNGCETPCVPDVDPYELCDGRDNDCDGQTDELYDLQQDPLHCGGCERPCRFANAVAGCRLGGCVIERCEEGFADIDRRRDNGCEALCQVTNGGLEGCDEVDNDCNGIVDDGYDLNRDPDNCGQCDRVCPAVPRATRACLGGECAVGECAAGWVDADLRVDTGCEYPCLPTNDGVEICDERDNDCDGTVDEGFDKQHGLEHCGGCDRPCAPANALPVCDEGVCRIAQCDDGWYDAQNGVSDGCELACRVSEGGIELCDDRDNDCNGVVDDGFDKLTDEANCGVCGNSCLQPHRRVACVQGNCRQYDCITGWVDQNQDAADGCEYACVLTGEEVCDWQDNDCDGETDEGFDLLTSLDHCGQCQRSCRYPSTVTRCQEGQCLVLGCEPGFWNADRRLANGCEYFCGVSEGGEEICDGRDNDCNGTIDDGFDLQNDPRNCGQCGRRCDLAGATAFCLAGECAVQRCDEGRRDVNEDPADGCECTLTNGGVEICDGRDNDCSGVIDDNLGLPPIACLRLGVCAGVLPRCDGLAGWTCPYPASYQAQEARCDDLDNDCDGQVDEEFPAKGAPCGDGVGVCRGEGRLRCDELTEDALLCPATAHPERQTAESCDGLDNDCDGETDEGTDELVQIGDLLVYKYEASRTDGTEVLQGGSFARACSVAGRLPWTGVDWDTARLACARAEGAYLCREAEWQGVCAGEAGWLYPYDADEYQAGACNGLDQGAGRVLPTGSLPGCVTPSGVADLSGNVWEWVDVDKSAAGDGSIRAFLGGGYGNVALGLSCTFDVAADPGTARDNIGFRCCTDIQCQEVRCAAGQYCRRGVCHDL
ncbi:MAG: MopE-related protein [Myxococcota bacterium]|nr:MopE-related protein [Myxococcota bacterium]